MKTIEEELLLTPWNLTSNFISAMEGKCLLQLTGFGDPFNHGEAFSFLRLPQKLMNQKNKDGEAPTPVPVPISEPKDEKPAVTGTDADLRKLSLEHARLVLLEFGMTEGIGSWLFSVFNCF